MQYWVNGEMRIPANQEDWHFYFPAIGGYELVLTCEPEHNAKIYIIVDGDTVAENHVIPVYQPWLEARYHLPMTQ